MLKINPTRTQKNTHQPNKVGRRLLRWTLLLVTILFLVSAVTSCSSTVSTGVNGIQLEKSLIKDERKSSGWKAYVDGVTGLYGFMDQAGKIVIEPSYLEAWDFYGGRAIVKVAHEDSVKVYGELANGFYGLITPKGNFEIEPKGLILRIDTWHYLITEQQEFWSGYGIGGDSVVKYEMIDGSGKSHGEQMYYYVIPLKDHIFVANDGYKSVFIDDDGKVLKNYPVFYFPIKATLEFETVMISPLDDQLGRMSWEMSLDGSMLNELHNYEAVHSDLTYHTQVISEYLGSSVFYPVFQTTNSQVQTNLNRGIFEIVKLNTASQNMQGILDYDMVDRIKVTAKTDYTIEIIGGVMVYRVEGYWMGLGASHANPHKQTYYFDLKTGEQFQVDQLFDATKPWKQVLLEKVDALLMADESLFLYYDKNTPTEVRLKAYEKANFGLNFTFAGLEIYFPVYELGPYAALFPTCEIALTEMSDYYDQNGKFYKALFGF